MQKWAHAPAALLAAIDGEENHMNRTLLYASTGVFVGALGLAWLTHGTGVVKNDIERHVYIPDQLTMPLQVKASYNGQDIFFRYRWPAESPSLFHDLAKFEGGEWVRKFGSGAGSDPEDMIEDRVTMMVDDGSVPEFARYGGYITIGDRMRFFTNAASADEVKKHPYLGGKLKKSDVRKYLPATRSDINDWASVAPQEELDAQRKAGYFLDLWHWRAARSNPIAASDDENIFDFRSGDAGDGPFTTNWDPDKKQPRFMLDKDKVGRNALSWDDIRQRTLGFDDVYYISQDTAVPFDPNLAWQEGDVIPRVMLRQSSGSHGDIRPFGEARWRDGYWDVTLMRAMETGNLEDDKQFLDQGSYTVAMAVHRNGAEGRWHYVSLPYSLGLGRQAEIVAAKFSSGTPEWNQPWTDVTLFYPGQVSWPHLNSVKHAGSENIKKGVPVKYRHSEAQLAYYGIEAEFADSIRRQWLLTIAAGILLIGGFGFSLNRAINRQKGN